MDIHCPKCGEPWDNDTFHDEAAVQGSTYQGIVTRFRHQGCSVFGARCNDDTIGSVRSTYAALAFDIMGDDTDGAASMMDDAEYFGLLD